MEIGLEKMLSDIVLQFILFVGIVATIVYGSIVSYQLLKKKIEKRGK
jgi:hypothetical protein